MGGDRLSPREWPRISSKGLENVIGECAGGVQPLMTGTLGKCCTKGYVRAHVLPNEAFGRTNSKMMNTVESVEDGTPEEARDQRTKGTS
ncbi:hypothetical protein TTRE_0000983401 [Trichuris trichiura]|uniref:Uncharacterized protein n=1 Tax=Trichuris trichiura TaxID=36087 RepID=A0A077ZRB8_TRITR|nr:hypothetical protein TTRE_0000983401 [Trichuris trichiura]